MDKNIILPKVEVGRTIGFLEILDDYGNKVDIAKIAADLLLDLDDVLPVVDTAEMFNFIKVEDNIPSVGKYISNAEIQITTTSGEDTIVLYDSLLIHYPDYFELSVLLLLHRIHHFCQDHYRDYLDQPARVL